MKRPTGLLFVLILVPVLLTAQTRRQDAAHESGTGDVLHAPTTEQDATSSPESSAGDGIVGTPAPPFIVRSLDDTTRYIGNMSFEGKMYLVDFWATWCPPCVAALPEMEKIYKEYHPKGFDMLSLSFDSSDERVREFRKKHFVMPWKHGRLEGGFNDVVSLSFHLQNIPHYVLVGRDAKILAAGDWIHGERLRELLEGYLGD